MNAPQVLEALSVSMQLFIEQGKSKGFGLENKETSNETI